MKVTFYYERPDPLTVDIPEPPDDVEEDELSDWILDHAPIQDVRAVEWDS
jgi:hypothetical protein